MQSESIKELATALAKAQSEMDGAKKNTQNPHFKSKFANLESVWDAAREPLSKNGLALIQYLDSNAEEGLCMVTMLAHTSGEWVTGRRQLCPKVMDPQGIGSAITYARRYDMMAMVGIAPEDDDAEAAMGRGMAQAPRQTATPPKPQQTQAPAPQKAAIDRLNPQPVSSAKAYDYVVPFGKKYKGTRLGEIPIEDAVNYAEWLEKQAQQKGEPLEGHAKEFYDMVSELVRQSEGTGFAALPADENIPF